jgi:hypothetical protein
MRRSKYCFSKLENRYLLDGAFCRVEIQDNLLRRNLAILRFLYFAWEKSCTGRIALKNIYKNKRESGKVSHTLPFYETFYSKPDAATAAMVKLQSSSEQQHKQNHDHQP